MPYTPIGVMGMGASPVDSYCNSTIVIRRKVMCHRVNSIAVCTYINNTIHSNSVNEFVRNS